MDFQIEYIVLILVAGFGVFAVREYFIAKSAALWPKTDGFITTSRIRVTKNGADVLIEYEYSVDGLKFSGERVVAGESFAVSGRLGAIGLSSDEKLLHRYPKGKQIKVRYSPRNHRLSCLEVGSGNPALIMALISVLVIAFCSYRLYSQNQQLIGGNAEPSAQRFSP